MLNPKLGKAGIVSVQGIKDVFVMSRRRDSAEKANLNIRLERRLLLHLKDLNASPTGVIDSLLRHALQLQGIDVTKPHPQEVAYIGEHGEPVLFETHWKRPESYDQDGEPVYPEGSPLAKKPRRERESDPDLVIRL